MYYRRKFLLALLEVMGGNLESIRLQKLLFLAQQSRKSPTYEFVPYQYGCYSFQAQQDLNTLIKYGLVEQPSKHKWKICKGYYLQQLSPSDQEILKCINFQFGEMSISNLVAYTYSKYPYYALNSRISSKYLNPQQLQKIHALHKPFQSPALLTIGYESKSLEGYLNQLLSANVNVLADVRRNAISMKYGFSKSQLKNGCTHIGIEYVHFPDLGIASELRQNLQHSADFDILFDSYKRGLSELKTDLDKLVSWMQEGKRVALTCFEAHQHQCHRGTLATSLQLRPDFNFPLIHL